MKKYTILALLILPVATIYWLQQRKDSSSGKPIPHLESSPQNRTVGTTPTVDATAVEQSFQGQIASKNKEKKESLEVKENSTHDDDLYRALDNLPANADERLVQEALMDIAFEAKDLERALNIFHEYGVKGYTPRSAIINRFAKQNPEMAKSEVNRLLLEYQSVADDDVKKSSAICGSIGNISEVDATDAVISAIKVEPSTRKRHCLFGVFVAYRNIPAQKQKEIIELAVHDKAKEIQQTGAIWSRNGRILNEDEMGEEYQKIANQKK